MHEPLMLMRTTGQARTDFDGALVESGEYVAAEYEATVAHDEFCFLDSSDSMSLYCSAAELAAEDLYTRDLEETQY